MFLLEYTVIQKDQNISLTVGDLHKITKTLKHDYQGNSMKVTVFFYYDAMPIDFSKTLFAKMD